MSAVERIRDHITSGATLLVSPERGWTSIGEMPYSPVPLLLYTVVLASWAVFWRGLGNIFGDHSAGWVVVDAVMFAAVHLGLLVGVGVLTMPMRRFARRQTEASDPMKLAIFSATPIWLLSILQVIPYSPFRAFGLLASLCYGCVLLFRGVPHLFGTEPMHTLGISVAVAAFWVLAATALIQVGLELLALI